MKKILLLTVVMKLIFISVGQSQQYTSFPVDSAKWREYHTQMGNPGYSIVWQEIDYSLNGDSSINSLVYHKLYQSEVSGEYFSFSPYGPYNAIYSVTHNILNGFIREANKNIYYLQNGQTNNKNKNIS